MENFEKEVLQRLTAIETKLDNYKEQFGKMEESNQYARRTAVGALVTVICAVIGSFIIGMFNWFKGGSQ